MIEQSRAEERSVMRRINEQIKRLVKCRIIEATDYPAEAISS